MVTRLGGPSFDQLRSLRRFEELQRPTTPAPSAALEAPALRGTVRNFVTGAPGAIDLSPAALVAGAGMLPRTSRDLGALTRSSFSPDFENLGTGNLSFPLVGGTPVGDQLAVVSRYIEPTQVALYDPATNRVTDSYEIPTGSGAFAVTASEDGTLYVGQYGARGEANLYAIDPASGEPRAIAALDSNLLWDLDDAPDGNVFGVGTQPSLVFRYDPATGTSHDIGIIQPGDNPRTVAATDDDVFVGGSREGNALLLAQDRATGQVQDILPPELADHTGVYTLEHSDRLLAAGTTGPDLASPALVVRDLETGATNHVTLPASEREIDAIAIDDATGEVFATARPSGTLYRYANGALEALATPVGSSETRSISIEGGRIHGVSAEGTLWEVDRQTGAVDRTDIVDAGATPDGEQLQSIGVNGDHLYTGGNFNVDIQNLTTGERTSIFLPGEAKDTAVVDGVTYFAVYPAGEVWSHTPGDEEAKLVAELPPSENRPVSLHASGSDLFIGSASDTQGDGGLHRLDTETGQLSSAPELFDGAQWIAGVTSADGVTFAGGGRGGLTAVDSETLQPLWEIDEVAPGAGALIGLEARGDKLYGFTSGGHFLVFDKSDGSILHQAQVAESGGRLVSAGGYLYGVNGDTVFRFDPDRYTSEARPLDEPSANFNHPFLTTDGDDVYVVQGFDVTRFEAEERATHFVRQRRVRV